MLCRRRRRPFRRGGGASSPCSVIVVAAATTTTIPVVTYLSLQSFVGITSRTRTNSTMDMHAEFRTFCCCFTATESSTSAWHNTHHAPSQTRSVAGGFPTQAHPSCRGCCLLSVTRRKAVAVRQQTLPATDQKWAVCSVRLGLSLGAKLIPGTWYSSIKRILTRLRTQKVHTYLVPGIYEGGRETGDYIYRSGVQSQG